MSDLGRRVVLFDRAQQARLRHAKLSQNVVEEIFVYILQKGNKGQNKEVHTTKLDLYQLLKGEEVHSISFDLWRVPGNFSSVYVQTKALQIFLIDFETKQVLKQLEGSHASSYGRSIFYDPQRLEKNVPFFERFKEFVQLQEFKGNQVLTPLVNEELIIVRVGESNLIECYCTRTLKIVRKFFLSIAPVNYPHVKNEIESMPQSQCHIDGESWSSSSQS